MKLLYDEFLEKSLADMPAVAVMILSDEVIM